MAHKITITLEDDLDGSPADETVRFAIGGAGYEIDLSTSNAAAFRRQLAPFIAHARQAIAQIQGRQRKPDRDRQPPRSGRSNRQPIDRHPQDQAPTRSEQAVPPRRPGPERAAG
jgi:hypothetical protein